jgi:hypothetical protein
MYLLAIAFVVEPITRFLITFAFDLKLTTVSMIFKISKNVELGSLCKTGMKAFL